MDQNKQHKTSFINVPQLLGFYRRNWKWVIVSVILFLALGYVYVKKAQPQSQVMAQILISDESSKASSSLNSLVSMFGGSGGSFGSNRSVMDEMIVIKSHSLLKETAQQLDMNVWYKVKKNWLKTVSVHYNPPVKLVYDKNIADTLSTMLTFSLKVDEKGKTDVTVKNAKHKLVAKCKDVTLPVTVETIYGNFSLIPGTTYVEGKSLDEKIELCSYDGVASVLERLLGVELSAKKTDIMTLSYVTEDPVYGLNFVNALMKNYNNLTIRQKQEFNLKTLSFLEDRISVISADVDSVLAQVEAFKGRSDLVSPEAQANIMILRTDTQELELIKAETEYELLTMAIEFLSNEANNTSMLPVMPAAESLTPLITGYNELILQRLAIETSAKGTNAALKAINEQINAVKDNLLVALNKQSETSSVQINEMRRQYAKYKKKLDTMPGIEREYTDILRQQTLKEQLYMYLLQQREQTELAIEGAHPKGVILDEAYVTDTDPNLSKVTVLAIFLLLGAMAPVIVYLLWLLANKHVCCVDQMVDNSLMTLIARVPVDNHSHQPIVTSNPGSLFAQRVRLLRDNILTLPQDIHSMAVIGTCGSDKSASLASNLAVAMALTGRRTVYIDADVFDAERGSINALMEVGTTVNTSTVGNNQQLKTISLNNGSQLDVMECKCGSCVGADYIASIDFAHMLASLKDTYDVVIVRTPDVNMNFASIETINNMVEMSLAVACEGITLKDDAAKLSKLDSHQGNAYFVMM